MEPNVAFRTKAYIGDGIKIFYALVGPMAANQTRHTREHSWEILILYDACVIQVNLFSTCLLCLHNFVVSDLVETRGDRQERCLSVRGGRDGADADGHGNMAEPLPTRCSHGHLQGLRIAEEQEEEEEGACHEFAGRSLP